MRQQMKPAFRNNFKNCFFLLITFLFTQQLFAQVPTLISFSPTTAGPGDEVTITGTNFTPGSYVVIGAGPASTQFISSTTLLANIGTSAVTGAPDDVTVYDGDNVSNTLSGFIFNGTPIIYSVKPATAGFGDTVTITGKYLAPGGGFFIPPTVNFGGVAAANVIPINRDSVKVVVGNGTSGSIYLANCCFGSTTYPGFVFKQTPVITSFSPTSAASGTSITIKGEYFTGATAVNFGGVAAQSYQVLNDTTITAVVGNGASGSISVTTATGPGSKAGFTIICTIKYHSISVSTCSSQLPYFWNGQYYNAAGLYEDTLTGFTGCDSVAILLLKILDPSAPFVDSIVNYTQNQVAVALTAVTDTGKSLLWYNTATGGIGSSIAPVPSTATIGTTVYYVSQIGVCEGPRAKISVIVSAAIPAQLCPPIGNTTLVSGLTGSNYQWQINTGSGFTSIKSYSDFTGANDSAQQLQLINMPSYFYGTQIRCVVDGNNGNVYTLKVIDTWIGTTDSIWENTANWSCGTLPDNNTDVIINSGTVVLKSNTTVRSITVSPGANFSVATGFNLTITH
jgi:hypothetical protein